MTIIGVFYMMNGYPVLGAAFILLPWIRRTT